MLAVVATVVVVIGVGSTGESEEHGIPATFPSRTSIAVVH